MQHQITRTEKQASWFQSYAPGHPAVVPVVKDGIEEG